MSLLTHLILQQAETTCTIGEGDNKVDCSDYVVDTKGGTQYPSVDVEYSTKVCNYNDFPIKYGEDKLNELKFWYTVPDKDSTNGRNQTFLVDENLNDKNLNGVQLHPGQCVEEKGTKQLSTTRSEYYMSAILNAPHDETEDGYCYAYAFNPIHLKYDYGDKPCDVTVSKHLKNKKTMRSYCHVLTYFFSLITIPLDRRHMRIGRWVGKVMC